MNEESSMLAATDGRWTVAGALTIDRAADVLAASVAMPLPQSGVIDLRAVDVVDSAAVALLLAWRRRARNEGKALVFDNLPASVHSLADLYSVDELIAPEGSSPTSA